MAHKRAAGERSLYVSEIRQANPVNFNHFYNCPAYLARCFCHYTLSSLLPIIYTAVCCYALAHLIKEGNVYIKHLAESPYKGLTQIRPLSCGFDSSVERALHRHRRGRGFESRSEPEIFFRSLFK